MLAEQRLVQRVDCLLELGAEQVFAEVFEAALAFGQQPGQRSLPEEPLCELGLFREVLQVVGAEDFVQVRSCSEARTGPLARGHEPAHLSVVVAWLLGLLLVERSESSGSAAVGLLRLGRQSEQALQAGRAQTRGLDWPDRCSRGAGLRRGSR